MLPEAEKDKYRAGLTKLPASGQGGMRAWATCLPPAPTALLGRAHPPLPATPIAPPVAPPPLPSDLAQMFDEPTIGLGAAPAAPQAPSMARTASPESLNPSPPRGVELPFYHHGSGRSSTITAVEVPRGVPPGFHLAATLANRLGGQLKANRTISSSASATSRATSSAYSCHPSCSSDDSESEPGNTATAPTAQFAVPPPLLGLAAAMDPPVVNASLHATLTASAPASYEEGSAESELMEAVLTDIMADEEVVLELQSIQGSRPAQANPETVAAVTMAEQPVIFHGVQGADTSSDDTIAHHPMEKDPFRTPPEIRGSPPPLGVAVAVPT